jgi:hypothetical protein
MDVRPIRFGFATQALQRASAGIQHRFQHSVGQHCWQRPGKLGSRRALEGERHRAAGDANRSGYRSLARATLVFEAQDLSYTSHRYSLGWHRLPRPSFPTTSKRPLLRPAVERRPHPSRVADFKSEWPRSNRNRWPTSLRNQWPTCSGISTPANRSKGLTENELSDFSQLWHSSCSETIIGAQHIDRNHSPKV